MNTIGDTIKQVTPSEFRGTSMWNSERFFLNSRLGCQMCYLSFDTMAMNRLCITMCQHFFCRCCVLELVTNEFECTVVENSLCVKRHRHTGEIRAENVPVSDALRSNYIFQCPVCESLQCTDSVVNFVPYEYSEDAN